MQAIYKINHVKISVTKNRRAPPFSLVAHKSNFTTLAILNNINGVNITDLDLIASCLSFSIHYLI